MVNWWILLSFAGVTGSLHASHAFILPTTVGKRFTKIATSPSNSIGSENTKLSSARPTFLQATSRSPQLLEFIEPTTGIPVKLVGCMHYNPASIQLTTDIINDLAQQDKLGSVVIESCDIRWNSSQVFPSEMKAACDLAMNTYERPVVLGDQRINITISSLKEGFQQTLVDFATPWIGGWGRIYQNITIARQEAVPFGEGYLSAFAFLDPKLLLAAPVSFVFYPLALFTRSPLRASLLFSLLFLTDQSPSDAAMLASQDPLTLGDWVGSLGIAAVETIIFARVFLNELLAQRNKILARNILEQCKLYQQTGEKKSPFLNFFGASRKNEGEGDIFYVEGSKMDKSPDQEKAIVAVLGMAHCNGIMKLLKEERA